MNLTKDQLKARAALLGDFRQRIEAAIWEGIENADPVLLASDDGRPYGEMRQVSTGMDSLAQMVAECTGKAIAHMGNWL